jgi:hypothetical protein
MVCTLLHGKCNSDPIADTPRSDSSTSSTKRIAAQQVVLQNKR